MFCEFFNISLTWPLKIDLNVKKMHLCFFTSSPPLPHRVKFKALRKAASSVFCSFAKFETNSVPILPKLSKMLCHNWIFIFTKYCSDLNFNWKFDYKFGTQGLSRIHQPLFANRKYASNFTNILYFKLVENLAEFCQICEPFAKHVPCTKKVSHLVIILK